VRRTFLVVLGGIALASTLVIGVAAAGASHLQGGSRPQVSGSSHAKASTAGAAVRTGGGTGDRTDTRGTLHYGPIPSGSPDSGTCGNDWAIDTFNRVFTVVTNADGTFRVVEDFRDATFVTVAGASPGACENGVTNHMVRAGISGRFQGYFLISVTGGTLDRLAACTTTNCGTTAGFVKTVFGQTATYNVTTFLFNYSSDDKELISRHWKNASADRGGNLGDIRTS